MNRLAAIALSAAITAAPAMAQTGTPALTPQPPAVAPPPAEAPAAVSAVDAETFVREAMDLHNVIVGTSRIAMLKAVDTAMKAYAEKAIVDHAEAAERLAEAAEAAGIDAEIGPDVLNQAYVGVYDRLSEAQEDTFAQLFIQAHEAAYADAMKLYTGYAESGGEPALRAVAAATLPTLLEHQTDLAQVVE